MSKIDVKDWRLWAALSVAALAVYWLWNRTNPPPLVSDLAWQQYDDFATKALDQ